MAKISRVRVQNYKSIIDSGWVEVDSDITTVVGPNEAGKSNFLEAISGFFNKGSYDDTELCSYNRDDWEGKQKSNIEVVSIEFENLSLSEAPYAYVDIAIFPEMISSRPDITLHKHADGEIYTVTEDGKIELSIYVDNKIREYWKLMKGGEIDNKNLALIDILSDKGEVTREMGDELNSEKRVVRTEEVFHEFTENEQNTVEYLPKVTLFEKIEPLSTSTTLDELEEGDNPAYQELIEFARLAPIREQDQQSRKLHRRERKTEEKLTESLNNLWDQAIVDLDIQFGPHSVSIHLYDSQGNHFTVGDRSTGMRWFLSFFFQLIASTSDDLQNNVILLDDPGVHLHPEGHRNLLDAFENLADDNQIIYCTHSPSLIDNDHIERIRVFERTPEEGTTVTSDLREATTDDDLDVLAPVRQSLGADISGSLFGSTKNVLVEGYTDKLYLNTFSEYFRRQGEDATFGYQMSLLDVDGSKTEYMVRFLDAEGYDYAVLLDDDDVEDAKSRKETLVEKDVDEDRIVLVSDVLDDIDEDIPVEIEDLLPPEIFCEVVAEEYPDDVDPDELVAATGEEYNTMPDAVRAKLQEIEQGELEDGAFNKGEIAETIYDRIASGEYGEEELGDQTLESFQDLISGLSNTLKQSD